VVRACVAGSDETELDAQDVWDRAQLLGRYVRRCPYDFARCMVGRRVGRSPTLRGDVQDCTRPGGTQRGSCNGSAQYVWRVYRRVSGVSKPTCWGAARPKPLAA